MLLLFISIEPSLEPVVIVISFHKMPPFSVQLMLRLLPFPIVHVLLCLGRSWLMKDLIKVHLLKERMCLDGRYTTQSFRAKTTIDIQYQKLFDEISCYRREVLREFIVQILDLLENEIIGGRFKGRSTRKHLEDHTAKSPPIRPNI